MSEQNLVQELKEIRARISDLRFFSKKAKADHDYNDGLDDSLQVIDSTIERLQTPQT